MTPSDRIKQIYTELGISQRGFSEQLGLHPTSISKIVSGSSGVSKVLALAIEQLFGYRADWILHEREPKISTVESLTLIDASLWYARIFASNEQTISYLEAGFQGWIDFYVRTQGGEFQATHLPREYKNRLVKLAELQDQLVFEISELKRDALPRDYLKALSEVVYNFPGLFKQGADVLDKIKKESSENVHKVVDILDAIIKVWK